MSPPISVPPRMRLLNRRRLRHTALATLLPALAACHLGADMKAAEAAAAKFHADYSAARYDSIYAGTAPVFRQSTTRKQFATFMSSLHQRVGAVRSSKRNGWKVDAAGGIRVTQSFETHFEKATGVETFRWRMAGGRPTLESYNIDSPALLMQ